MKLRTTLTLAAAGRYLQTPQATLVYYANTGELPALPLGRTLLFHRAHLDKFIKESAEKRAAAIRLERASAPAACPEPPPDASLPVKRGAKRKHNNRQGSFNGGAASASAVSDAGNTQPDLPGLEPVVRLVREPR